MGSHRKRRIDQRLVEEGLPPSRTQAADLVRRGCVLVDGLPATKPGAAVADNVKLALLSGTDAHVSRGALKLIAALDAFDLSPEGCIALDVGHDQLHVSLRADPRVVSLEATDARHIDEMLVPQTITAIAADVSFISLTQALPAALDRAAPGAWPVALVKPQFEAGREAVGKGGLVRAEVDRQRAIARVRDFLEAQGWNVLGLIESPITGGSGNVEYLIGARNDR